jgi:hypothetical protein
MDRIIIFTSSVHMGGRIISPIWTEEVNMIILPKGGIERRKKRKRSRSRRRMMRQRRRGRRRRIFQLNNVPHLQNMFTVGFNVT